MEFQLLKKIAHIFTLTLPLAFVACGGTNSATEATPAPTQATVAAKSCTGSYVGTIDKPSLEIRLGFEEEIRRRRGIIILGPDDNYADVYNPNILGSIYLAGSFAFETDANCKVVKGGVSIFNTYPFDVIGTVNADRRFDIQFTGSGVTGAIVGEINPDNTITGQLKHPAPDDFIYGLLNGKFTPNGKI
jgi:hypothetical protein